MTSKNLTCATLGLCGSLLALTASTATQAADQPAKQLTTPNAKQDMLVCRDLDIPGSHIKWHVCGVPANSSEAQTRLYLSLANPAASGNGYAVSGGPSGIDAVSSAGLSGSIQR